MSVPNAAQKITRAVLSWEHTDIDPALPTGLTAGAKHPR
jgi:hypothetical protein